MMKRLCIVAFSVILVCSLAILAGCQKASEQTSSVKGKTTETSAGYSATALNGASIGKLIYEEMPYTKWALWPGKGKLFRGTEPHGFYITVYVNNIGLESIKRANGMADNSIVLKENYNADKQLTSVTVMQKAKGYDPDGGDWFWVRFGPDSKVTAEGKVIMCLGCHTVAKDNDFIYTGKVTAKGPPGHGAPGYGKTAPGYSAPGYGKSAPGYGKTAPGYGKTAPGYGAPGYGKSAPGYK